MREEGREGGREEGRGNSERERGKKREEGTGREGGREEEVKNSILKPYKYMLSWTHPYSTYTASDKGQYCLSWTECNSLFRCPYTDIIICY